MEERSEQTVELAASAEPLDENLAEADREDAAHSIENILETDITGVEETDDHSAETEIEIKEEILIVTTSDDIVDVPNIIEEKLIDDSKGSKDSAELKLDGIEGKEDPLVEPVQLELLSQQKSSFIGSEIIEEENEDEEEYSIRMSVPDDTDYFDDEGKDHEEIIDTVSPPEYPVYDRESLLQQYKEAVEERAKIQNQNQQFQHKLAEYFKKKKTDDRGQEIEKNVNDQEQRYLKYMSNLEELQKVEERQGANIEIQLEDMRRKCTEMKNKVEESSNEFINFKYDIAKTDAINSRSGKHIPQKDLDQYRKSEEKKEQEVIAVRLENIKLKNRLKKREQQLKAKEELAEGLHLIDFEQLKIENQTYHEKIEERNEELLKLRKKITTTVQVLTHLKEKLQFVQGENGEQRAKLRDIEVTVAQRRDILTRLKQVRDALRIDNNKLKHKAGLLGNKPLLKDYEIRKDEGEELRTKLESLKSQHVDLNLTLQGVKKKIEKSKPAQPI